MLFDYLTGVWVKFYADLLSLPETLVQYPLNISRWSGYLPGTGLVKAVVVSDLVYTEYLVVVDDCLFYISVLISRYLSPSLSPSSYPHSYVPPGPVTLLISHSIQAPLSLILLDMKLPSFDLTQRNVPLIITPMIQVP